MSPSPSIKSKRHHYIPQMYLKRWNNSSGKIYVYSPNRSKKIECEESTAKITGYEEHLNRLKGLPGDTKYLLEHQYFGGLDGIGSNLLDDMERSNFDTFMIRDIERRIQFSKIFGGFRLRHPIEIYKLEERIELGQLPLEPLSLDFKKYLNITGLSYTHNARLKTLEWVWRSIEAPFGPTTVANMNWRLVRLRNSPLNFVTSDQPVAVLGPIGAPNSALGLPLGPRTYFFATKSPALMQTIISLRERDFVMAMNRGAMMNAYRFVASDKPISCKLVEKYFDTASDKGVYDELKSESSTSRYLRDVLGIRIA
jgi:hypothetical protein